MGLVDIVGYDSVSSLLLPYNAKFNTSSGGIETTIEDISAMVFTSLDRALMLADRSHIYSAQFTFLGGELAAVTFEEDSTLNASFKLDSEGIALMGGDVYISTESPPEIYRCPLLPDRSRVEGPCIAALDTSEFASALHNQGFESLCITSTAEHFITGTEANLPKDSSGAVRLTDCSTATGLRARELLYSIEKSNPPLRLVELLALDAEGLAGGQLLALERGWKQELGNEIRLYLVNTAGATDVSQCENLGASQCDSTGQPVVAAAKKELLRWTASQPLDGHVKVDNYEGMALLPGNAVGRDDEGIWLMLVNDNNSNINQIGTQFVLLRLLLGASGASLGGGPAPLIVSLLALVALACALAAFFVLRRRKALARKYQNMDSLAEQVPPPVADLESAAAGGEARRSAI